jgi:predicted negative regulator of RcsB-dependent stress response
MWDVFRSDPEKLGGVIFWAIIVIGVLGYAGIKAWRYNEAGKRDAELKLEMVAKGMSAADIERILAAKTIDSQTAETTYHKK